MISKKINLQKMLRPLSQKSTRTCSVYLNSSSFTQNALFSTGLGRGSTDQITLGGKSISLSQRLKMKQEINVNMESETKVNVQPDQFEDAVEERKKTFQSLAEPVQEPLKQMYEGHKSSSSPPLRHERNVVQQKSNQLDVGVHKREMKNSPQFKLRNQSEPPKNKMQKSRQTTDFVVREINWSDYVNSDTNKLDPNALENKEERLESGGGDYDHYISFPKSIQEKFNLDNNISNSLKKVIGQNPSYKLPEKKLFYETLFQNLNTSM